MARKYRDEVDTLKEKVFALDSGLTALKIAEDFKACVLHVGQVIKTEKLEKEAEKLREKLRDVEILKSRVNVRRVSHFSLFSNFLFSVFFSLVFRSCKKTTRS